MHSPTALGAGPARRSVFFLVVVTLLPLGIGPDSGLLSRIAPGALWVALLLAVLLSTDRLFQADFEDGSLELMLLSPVSLELVVLCKAFTHWLTTGLPLAVAAPVPGVLLNIAPEAIGPLVLATLIGSPALSLLGTLGAGVTLGLSRGGLLLSMIVLPLYVPVLIFGVSAASTASAPSDISAASLLILGALSLASLVLCPLATAAAIRSHFR